MSLLSILNLGSSPTDSIDTAREKKVLLAVHVAVMLGGPVPNIILFIASGLRWAALVTALAASLPAYVSFGLFMATRNVKLSTWIISLMPLFGPLLIVLFCGGPLNSGYLPYMFLSPMVWLCITRKLAVAGLLFGLATVAMVVVSAAEPALYQLTVERQGWVPAMSATWLRWHYCFNLIQLQTLVLGILGFLLRELAPQLKAYVEVQARMDEVAHKVLKMDLDDIPEPGPDAMELEKSLFSIVMRMREWRPFIPSTLFITHSDGEGEEQEVQKPIQGGMGAVESFVLSSRSGPSTKVASRSATQLLETDSVLSGGVPDSPHAGQSGRCSSPDTGVHVLTSRSKKSCKSETVVHVDSSSRSTESQRLQSVSDTRLPKLPSRTTTMVVITVSKLLPEGLEPVDAYQRSGLLLDTAQEQFRAQKGAEHQFFGDTIVGVFTGANQQLRACQAVLKVV
eukprot:RCo050796